MITGDHLLIGKETAKMLGMGTAMYTSATLIKVRGVALQSWCSVIRSQDAGLASRLTTWQC